MYLYLNNNKIGSVGVQKIANELLSHNTTLKSVIIFNNLISEEVKQEMKRQCGNRMCLFNPLS